MVRSALVLALATLAAATCPAAWAASLNQHLAAARRKSLPHHTHQSGGHRPKEKIHRNTLKFKHQPANPEEDWWADNLYPRHVFSHLRAADAVAAVAAAQTAGGGGDDAAPDEGAEHGRRLADVACSASMCHGYSCAALLASSYSCDDLVDFYGCPSCAACEVCARPTYGDDDGGCIWPAGKPTSCGAPDESLCHVDSMEAEQLGRVHPFRVKYVRQYLDATADDPGRSSATCFAAGQIVDPCFFDYGRDNYRCPVECTQEDVFTAEKREFVNERLDWAEKFLGMLFQTVDLCVSYST